VYFSGVKSKVSIYLWLGNLERPNVKILNLDKMNNIETPSVDYNFREDSQKLLGFSDLPKKSCRALKT